MKNKLWASAAAVALVAGGVTVAVAGPAEAHTQVVSADCQALTVNLTAYADSQPGKDAVPPVYQDIPHHDLVTPGQDAVAPVYGAVKWEWTGGKQVLPPEFTGAAPWNKTGDTHPNKWDQIGKVQGIPLTANWSYWEKVVVTPGKDAVAPVYRDWVEHKLIKPGADAVPAKTNHVTVTDNGNSLADTDFGTSYSKVFPSTDKTIDHTYVVTVASYDGIGAFTKTLNVKACEKPAPEKSASWSITTTPATCEANGTATASGEHVVLPALDETPGTHTATAGLVDNYDWKNGQTATLTYTIEAKKADASCYPPQTCTASGNWYSEDVPPVQGENGLIFTGGKGAVDAYFPASGNLQGLGTQSLTFTDVAGYQPSYTIVFNRFGTSGYANLVAEWYMNGGSAGESGTFTVTPSTLFWTNKIASGAGSQSSPQPLSFFIDLWPSNKLIAVGPHLGSAQTADTHSTVSAINGCANGGFVPTKPEPKIVTSDWTDSSYGCDSTDVEQTRTVTTTEYVWDAESASYVLDTEHAKVETQTQHRDFTAEEKAALDIQCAGPQPENKVTFGEWQTGKYGCGDTTVTEKRTVTDTPYKLVGREWVLDTENTSTKTETHDRKLTDAEIKALNCPVTTPTPTPKPTASTPAAPAGQGPSTPVASSSENVLAHTGSDITPWVAGGILLLLIGGAAVWFGNRRKKAAE